MRIAYCLVFFLAFSLAACATPRIVLLSDPLDAREHNDLGVAYEASGQTTLALESYESAFTKDRSWDQPLINHGNVHASLGNWTEAEASYRKALKRNPQNPEAMNNLAFALVRQKKGWQALEWSAKALDIEPDNALFKSTRALALLEAGEKKQGLELLHGLLKELPADDPLHGEITAVVEQMEAISP